MDFGGGKRGEKGEKEQRQVPFLEKANIIATTMFSIALDCTLSKKKGERKLR